MVEAVQAWFVVPDKIVLLKDLEALQIRSNKCISK